MAQQRKEVFSRLMAPRNIQCHGMSSVTMTHFEQHPHTSNAVKFGVCPLSGRILHAKNAVLCSDGVIYDSKAIAVWLQSLDISPVNGVLLPNKILLPCPSYAPSASGWTPEPPRSCASQTQPHIRPGRSVRLARKANHQVQQFHEGTQCGSQPLWSPLMFGDLISPTHFVPSAATGDGSARVASKGLVITRGKKQRQASNRALKIMKRDGQTFFKGEWTLPKHK